MANGTGNIRGTSQRSVGRFTPVHNNRKPSFNTAVVGTYLVPSELVERREVSEQYERH